ncbi:hypothetical protein EV424DRAFT_1350243 [Suillus variegatus]|nr:hypothetical protein EV424DRAFT_1350243 [Suillus variegatus]
MPAVRALNYDISVRKKPKPGLKIIPFNPAPRASSRPIFTDTAPGTFKSQDSQTPCATNPVTLSWHHQPMREVRKCQYNRKQNFLSLERGYKHYLPNGATPPGAHPPVIPPPSPAPPRSPPPLSHPSPRSPPPLSHPSPRSPTPPPPNPPSPNPPPPLSHPPLPPSPKPPPGKPTVPTAKFITGPGTVSYSEVPLAHFGWLQVRVSPEVVSEQPQWDPQNQQLWDQFVQWPSP